MPRRHPHDPDIQECAECGAQFDLARQSYYGPKCPNCTDDKRTWPSCWDCGDKIPPDERDTKNVRGGPRDPATVSVPVHKDCD